MGERVWVCLFSLAHYGGCDLKSAGQAYSLYSRCLGYALPMVLSTKFPMLSMGIDTKRKELN